MNAEDRLSELMDAATRALNPPLEAMLEEGVRRGRIRRRRRRAAVAGAAVAAVLVAAGGAALARDTDGPRYDVGGAAETSGVPTASTRPSALPASAVSAAASAPSPTSTILVPINAAAAAGILRQLVGNDLTLLSYNTAETGNGVTGTAIVIVRDQQGLAQVLVTVANVKDGIVDPVDCAQQAAQLKAGGARPAGALSPSCSEQTLAGGAKAMQEVLGANAFGVYQTRVIVDRTDGVVVEIAAANGILSPTATKYTRADPPLSVSLLTVVALNPLWQTEVPVALARGK